MRTTHFPVVPSAPATGHQASVEGAAAGRVVFTGNEQHEISLAEAARLTRNFRERADRGAAKGGLLARGVIEKILAQDSCVGVRFYHGLDANEQQMMVMVGVTMAGTNQVHGTVRSARSYVAPFGVGRNILNLSLTGGEPAVPTIELGQNQPVTIAEAADLVRRYRRCSEPTAVRGVYFSQAIFSEILSQPNCIGVRYYYGYHDTGEPCLVLVGVTKEGDDLIPGRLGEIGLPCPPICGGLDALNT